jgi:hypothetical protein
VEGAKVPALSVMVVRDGVSDRVQARHPYSLWSPVHCCAWGIGLQFGQRFLFHQGSNFKWRTNLPHARRVDTRGEVKKLGENLSQYGHKFGATEALPGPRILTRPRLPAIVELAAKDNYYSPQIQSEQEFSDYRST